MSGEAAQFATVLERIARGVLDQLGDLPDDALNQPVPLPESNSLFALATHLVGAAEFWVLALAGGRAVERDRSAEFHASGTGAQLTARYRRFIQALHEVLDPLPDAALSQIAEPPSAYRGTIGDAPVTLRECLIHAVEHAALHQGHIQITRGLVLAEAGAPAAAQPDEPPAAPHILAVDDDAATLAFITAALSDEGYTVTTAGGGMEAFEAIARQRPSAILLDLQMPDMDGWEVLNRVRALGLEIPVVLMTVSHRAQAEAERLEFDAFIAKPFEIDTLLAVIRSVAPVE